MKISVIIPIYNMGKYLERCLDSIEAQGFKSLEVILVNDGSTDNSLEICNMYASKNSIYKVIDKENGGVSSARNRGLDLCSGDYITFIDPDDYIDKNLFECLSKRLEQDTPDLLWCNFYEEKDRAIRLVDIIKEDCNLNLNLLQDKMKFISDLDKKYHSSAFLFCKIYKSNIFEGIRFPYGRLCEDGFILYHLLSRVKSVSLCKSAYYHYCQREDGLCRGNKDDSWRIDWIESRLTQAIIYNFWGKELSNGQREYMLYRAFRNALLYIPKSREKDYENCIPYIKKELNLLLKSNLSFRHKLSIYKILLKYQLNKLMS